MDIQLPEDIRVIRAALSENEEYQTLRKQAERWEKSRDYSGAGCMYLLFWPVGLFMIRSMRRSQEASIMADYIEYVVADAYFRTLDPTEDYLRQLHKLSDDYWAGKS